MGSRARARRRRQLARGSSAAICPEHSDAVPVRTEDGDDYVRVNVAAVRRHDAATTWSAMCRVEQMLRERRR